MLVSEAIAADVAASGHEAVAFYATPDFWVGMAFVVVVLVLIKPLGKVIKSVTSSRADKISQKIEEARRLKDEAALLLTDYQKRFKNANEESAAIIERAKVNAERIKKEEEENINLLLAKKEEKAFSRIKSAEDGAISEVRDCTVKIAVAVSSTVIKEKIIDEVGATLANQAIKELPSMVKVGA